MSSDGPDLKVILSMLFLAVGLAAQTFTTSTNSLTQMSTEPRMRGRVIAILLAIALGGTPIGAPIAGWVADHFGPRWALAVGAASGLLAAAIATLYLIERKRKLAARDLQAKPAENAF